MPQVRIAAAAGHLDAAHAMAEVFMQVDAALVGHIPEAGPAAMRVVLGIGLKQRLSTGGAVVSAIGFLAHILACERALGGGLAQDGILIRAELAAPFGIGLADFRGHGGLSFLRCVSTSFGENCYAPLTSASVL